MSRATLILFRDGQPTTGLEFHNAWGGASRIWDALYGTYLKDASVPHDTWLSNYKDRRLWDLAKRQDLALFERAVHAFTFDLAYVRKEHFETLAEHLRQFQSHYPVPGYVDHLGAWADVISASDAEAVALYATSVSENPWFSYDQMTEKYTPIPLSNGFEVYDWLETLTTQPA